jgi:Cu-processing system ATP-binding protein
MISLQHISKKFSQLQVLHNAHLELLKGQTTALIGPNGSGKTTLIKILLGLVKPDQGTITFNNQSILHSDLYRSALGYMPQISRYPDHMKVLDLFELLKSLRTSSTNVLDEELLKSYAIEELYPKELNKLSGGTRQKVGAALAFLFNPQCYILDEPTAGLDPLSAEILKAKIIKERNNGKCILITSHILNDLEDLATHIAYIHEGRILFHVSISETVETYGTHKLSVILPKLVTQYQPIPSHAN